MHRTWVISDDSVIKELEEAFAAKTILEGLDREAPLMTKQEQLEVKEDIAYSLKLYDLHGR